MSVRQDSLVKGRTVSCGCVQNETKFKKFNQLQRKYEYNKYDLSGEFGVGWTANTNQKFYFDLEDYDLIKNYCWSMDNDGYIISNVPYKIMHRLVLNANETEIVDHIYHNKFDNRKSKLRIVTSSQNSMNRKIHSNNTSGTKGVCRINNKWNANICANGEKHNLGYFDNLDDAVKVRKEAELKLFGEYNYQSEIVI